MSPKFAKCERERERNGFVEGKLNSRRNGEMKSHFKIILKMHNHPREASVNAQRSTTCKGYFKISEKEKTRKRQKKLDDF